MIEQTSEAGECCPGLLSAPLDEGQAVELSKVFKALGDPVRLRLLSMIASKAGGEVCVCDLTPRLTCRSRRSRITSSCFGRPDSSTASGAAHGSTTGRCPR